MNFGFFTKRYASLGKSTNKLVQSKHYRRTLFVLLALFAFACTLGLLYYVIFVNNANVARHSQKISVTEPIKINFTKRVSHAVAISINPASEYNIVWSDSLLVSSASIVPKSRWQTGTDYDLRLADAKTTLNQPVAELDYIFKTQGAPNIVSSSPANDSKEILTDAALTLAMDLPNEDLISPKLTFTPEAKYQINLAPDKMSYNVVFDEKLKQSTVYQLLVTDEYRPADKPASKLYEAKFTTVPKVAITDFSLKGNMNLKNSALKIAFDNDMNRETIEKAFTINPAVEGTFSWPDNQNLIFTPKSVLVLNTTYNIMLTAGAKNSVGGVLEENYTNSFGTIGYVTAYLNPGWGSREIEPNSQVRVNFNQAVDHASAQNSFSLNPATDGGFSWSGNTMIYSPIAQGYLANYMASVRAGVRSINGLDSTQAFSTSYTTVTPVTMINVPFYRQNYNLSCEIAALKMALANKGVGVSEDSIFGVLGYDGPEQRTADNQWGNPNRGFVGNVNGNGTTTGYGVDWGPIARAANNFRPSQAFSGGSLQTLTSSIDAGNPVIVWGTLGNPYSMSWTDISTGEAVSAVKGEHARVVKGYRGLAASPIGFYLVDPIYGNLYWDSSRLLSDWSWFNYSGVIIR